MTAAFLEGQVQASQGKMQDAANSYMKVIGASPDAPLSQHALLALVATSKTPADLEQITNFIAGLKSNNPFINTILGECYANLKKNDKAAAALDQAIAAGATVQDAYLARAKLYMDDGKKDQAIDMLSKGSTAAPTDIRAPLMQADIYRTMGRYADAVAIYDHILQVKPEADLAANNLAAVIADHQYDDKAALEKARKVAERFAGSSNPALLDTLAWLYYRQNNLDQALPIMERAVNGQKDVPAEIHYHYGVMLAKLHKNAEAKAELEKATVAGADYPALEDAKKLLASL